MVFITQIYLYSSCYDRTIDDVGPTESKLHLSILDDDPLFLHRATKQTEKRKPRLTKGKLSKQLHEKLSGGRFRYINEQLYSITGDKAKRSFELDPSLFDAVLLLLLLCYCNYKCISLLVP